VGEVGGGEGREWVVPSAPRMPTLPATLSDTVTSSIPSCLLGLLKPLLRSTLLLSFSLPGWYPSSGG
jgi:hypothetical protein